MGLVAPLHWGVRKATAAVCLVLLAAPTARAQNQGAAADEETYLQASAEYLEGPAFEATVGKLPSGSLAFGKPATALNAFQTWPAIVQTRPWMTIQIHT